MSVISASNATSTGAAKTRPGALAESGSPSVRPPAAAHLSDEQVAELGRELDAIRDEILAKRGASDAAYIRRMIKIQRGLEISGRAALLVSKNKAAWVTGTTLLSLAKILENMELGHNILHGQWDWMRDPDIHSTTWEWDFVTPSRSWQHTHNDLHHRWTNVVGKDNDIGYNLLRMDPSQEWKPFNLGNPLWALLLAVFFEWGIAIQELELGRVIQGRLKWATLRPMWLRTRGKILRQMRKDYLLFPLLAGPFFFYVAGANAVANIIRNLWTYLIIFCGHFPMDVHVFTKAEVENETRAHWYVRQLLGSCNISGGKLFHIMSGNLSHQIEQHLFRDMPSNRYAEVAPRVRALCAQ